jgi:hypothetical protein
MPKLERQKTIDKNHVLEDLSLLWEEFGQLDDIESKQ